MIVTASVTTRLMQGIQSLGIDFNEIQQQNLLTYLDLLLKWNKVYNLTAIRTPDQMVTHHLLDSLAAVPAFLNAEHVLDVGAGGGLPGMVLAIWASVARPAMRISMVDPIGKKTAFLTQVKLELSLENVQIYTTRVEKLQVAQKFDVITSRAFAELQNFIHLSAHLLSEHGQFIALKGAAMEQEISQLPADWTVVEKRPLIVPGLEAKRYLVFIQRLP